jgi:hypothetical protein
LGEGDKIDSWGSNPRAQIQGGQPTFKPSTGLQSIWKSYGDDPGWQSYFHTDPSLGSANIQTPKPGGPTTTGAAGTSTSTSTGTGSMDLLAYRPGTADYWQKYMGPKMTDSLMKFQMPKVETGGLSYLPGEMRNAAAWGDFLGMGGTFKNYYDSGRDYNLRKASPDKQFQGLVPQGSWRRGTDFPTKYWGGKGWDFTAPRTNIAQMVAQTPWTAPNLTPAAAGQWSGLLGDWAAPALNTTNLLGAA